MRIFFGFFLVTILAIPYFYSVTVAAQQNPQDVVLQQGVTTGKEISNTYKSFDAGGFKKSFSEVLSSTFESLVKPILKLAIQIFLSIFKFIVTLLQYANSVF